MMERVLKIEWRDGSYVAIHPDGHSTAFVDLHALLEYVSEFFDGER